jgi:prolyl 4-hydroxylase
MKVQCAPVCFSCSDIIFENRCPTPDVNLLAKSNVWGPGDLHRMFTRIVTLPPPQNATLCDNISILDEFDVDEHTDPQKLMPKVTVLSQPHDNSDDDSSPWVVQIDEFLTQMECDVLIQLGTDRGYQRSTGLNSTKNSDGSYGSFVDDVRTSSNTWCLDECYHHPVTQRILQRIEYWTKVPDINSEYLQLLSYTEGQYYKTHHDYIDFHVKREQGVRVATVFLYLNDVEEGE